MRLAAFAVLALAIACSPAPAPEETEAAATEPVTVGAITIEGAAIRPPPGGVTTGAGYLTIRNAGAEADRLLGASSPVAATIELHTHRDVGGVMRMERVEFVDVPAGGAVTFAPGGLHLMLFGWSGAAPKAMVTLRFEKAGEATVPFAVGTLGPEPKHGR